MDERQLLPSQEVGQDRLNVEDWDAYEDWVSLLLHSRTSIDNPEWMNVNF